MFLLIANTNKIGKPKVDDLTSANNKLEEEPDSVLKGSLLAQKNDEMIDEQQSHRPLVLPPKGDIDGNGIVNENDMDTLLKGLVFGDMNDDKVIDDKDIQLLKEAIGYKEPPPLIPLGNGGEGSFRAKTEEGKKPDIVPPHPRKGDINQDGKIDQKDLQLLLRIFRAGDMNSDSKVDYGNDVRLLNENINKIGPKPLDAKKQ